MGDLNNDASGARGAFTVGLGASAGGLEALERFFEHLPSPTGMAFVVVQHLSPDFKSLMGDILSRKTSLPVYVATDGMAVRPEAVYLNPPKKQMIISEGRLLLTDRDPDAAITYPIDHFLRSLANDAPGRSAAVILSGTGGDGSRGVREVRRAGGLVIAQDPATATFDGMPRSAIATGSVDLTIAPAEMGEALVAFARGKSAANGGGLSAEGLSAVVKLLRDTYGVDFGAYKLPTIARRTERRMRACGEDEVARYVGRLASDPTEVDALYRDLLIGVTGFFRDAEAFAQLEAKVVPDLLARVSPDDEVRAWVAGCATGEEAYSLAIVLREALDARGLANPVRIFATDVHREALRAAAAGAYDDAALEPVAPARRERFFPPSGGRRQAAASLRSMIVFAPHDLLRDVPFTKLDLVSCRNLLIYLQPSAQRRALSLFHFGLRAGGALFLGPSEALADLNDEFEVVDARWKLFRKRRDVRLLTDFQPGGAGARARLLATAPPPPEASVVGAYDAVLDAVLPPSLLVGARRNLVHAFGGASRFLAVPEGRATVDVVELLRGDLRVAITGALQRAFARPEPARYRDLRVELGGRAAVVDLTVRQVRNRRTDEPFALVTFEERAATPAAPDAPAAEVAADELARDQVLALEAELKGAREDLRAAIEELETSNEELQATNEELVASNEELQTTNQELHSVNEELFSVNAEYQRKIVELTELTGDMDHLLASTEVHTLFLDRELRIRRFTPTVAEIFRLVPGDVGRCIDAFNHTLDRPELADDVRRVVATGESLERQVRDARGRWFLLRVLPYRRGESADGAVLTLVDIGALKRLEAEAHSKDAQLSHILANSPHPVFMRDAAGRFVLADESFRRLAGRDPVGLRTDEIFSPEVAAALTRDDARVLAEGITVEAEEVIPSAGGGRVFLTVKFPVRDAGGDVRGLGGIQTDVTSLKRAEAEARESVLRRDRFLATLSHELRNPLAAVLNSARALARGGVAAGEAATFYRLIVERAEHMSRLVDDLLDVTRMTQDKLVLERRRVDLRGLARGVLDETEPLFRERGVRLESRVDGAELAVAGDPTRLHQLQVNLLANAARYTPGGGTATYSVARVGDGAEIRVSDSGEGIAPDMLGRVFDLFVQAALPGARGRDGGLGVGLALVRRIVELHGGTVSVASAGLGKGTEFLVRLPLAPPAPAAETAPPPTESAPPPADGAAPARPRTVLVVDDDPSSRVGMGKLLEMDGIAVAYASDGGAALSSVVGAGAPDLILLDIGLPDLDGYEVCRRLRALPGGAAMRVFALTGFGQESDRAASEGAGFDAHLTKPVDVDDVYAHYERHARRAAP